MAQRNFGLRPRGSASAPAASAYADNPRLYATGADYEGDLDADGRTAKRIKWLGIALSLAVAGGAVLFIYWMWGKLPPS